jgi:glycosyltransferase involved in cell wall biosynthesis
MGTPQWTGKPAGARPPAGDSLAAAGAAPTVSVVIPAYNATRWLGRTLAAVRSQTFADFEVLVVDDESTDDTARVAADFAAKDSRVRVLRQANRGAAAARNRGLRLARGRYIANLDADDIWRPTFLARLLATLEARPEAVLAFCRSEWIDAEDESLPGPRPVFPAEPGYCDLLLRNPIGNGSCTVVRSEALRAVGGFDEDTSRRFGTGEDWLTFLRLSWRGPIAFVDEELLRYRVHADSASHGLVRSRDALSWVIRRCREEGPPLPGGVFRDARSLGTLWLSRRARAKGEFWLWAQLLTTAYLRNPAWPRMEELRRPFADRLRPRIAPRPRSSTPS